MGLGEVRVGLEWGWSGIEGDRVGLEYGQRGEGGD